MFWFWYYSRWRERRRKRRKKLGKEDEKNVETCVRMKKRRVERDEINHIVTKARHKLSGRFQN